MPPPIWRQKAVSACTNDRITLCSCYAKHRFIAFEEFSQDPPISAAMGFDPHVGQQFFRQVSNCNLPNGRVQLCVARDTEPPRGRPVQVEPTMDLSVGFGKPPDGFQVGVQRLVEFAEFQQLQTELVPRVVFGILLHVLV